MAFCGNCGYRMDDTATVCSSCGQNMYQNTIEKEVPVQQDTTSSQETVVQQGQQYTTSQQQYAPAQQYGHDQQYSQGQQPNYQYVPPRKGQLNTGFLVWSIINTLICCMPLGIAGLVFTITAQNKPTLEEEQKALKNAKIFNLIGTIVAAVGVIGYIIFLIVMLSLGSMSVDGF